MGYKSEVIEHRRVIVPPVPVERPDLEHCSAVIGHGLGRLDWESFRRLNALSFKWWQAQGRRLTRAEFRRNILQAHNHHAYRSN